jgi:hypothetical protein
MKKIYYLTLLFISAFVFQANAQYYYNTITSSGNPGGLNTDNEYSNTWAADGWTSILGPAVSSPTWSANQTIPFTFNFDGSTVTQYKVSSTGVLTFTTSAATVPGTSNSALPSSGIPDKSICIWGLICSGGNDEIVIKTFGSAPNRQQWIYFPSNTLGGAGWTYMSIVLEETTDKIYIVEQRNYNNSGTISAGIQVDGSNAYSLAGSPSFTPTVGNSFESTDNVYHEFIFGTPSAVDMGVTELSISPTVVAGPLDITGTVTSYSSNNITSFDISWDDGTGPYTETFSVNMNYGDTYNFTHGTALNTVAGQTYIIAVNISAAGDANATNDLLSTSVSTVSSLVNKVVVGEEKTGEWCGWCPRGGVALAEMSLSNPDDFIGIAVHNGDGMTVAQYDGNIGTYISGGYPGGGVDRVASGNPASFSTMHNARKTHVPPASVTASGTYDANTITVNITADFVGAVSGDHRLAAVLIQDSVTGSGQANYYAGGGSGAMTMPNTGSMPNYEFGATNAPQTVNPYYHDHVAIALGNNQINGTYGSVGSGVSVGDSVTYTYTFSRNSDYNMGKVHVVGMLVNGSTGEILNAGKGNLISTAVGTNEISFTTFELNSYPNPTNGITNLFIDIQEAGNIEITILNILGETVYQNKSEKVNAGNYTTSIDLSNESNGIYLAYVTVNNQQKTIRINLNK